MYVSIIGISSTHNTYVCILHYIYMHPLCLIIALIMCVNIANILFVLLCRTPPRDFEAVLFRPEKTRQHWATVWCVTCDV